ncbi:MAG TPA: hypothetical protein DIS98_01485 [Colwellia sp.]|nr:hypothetical protein [Colwellia sp.]|tara:strand:- start:2662 stop:3306 length:645 start_codon:yes stop_codon:yes gene_type:complete
MKQNQDEDNTVNDESRRNFFRGLTMLVGSTAATVLLTSNSISVAMAYSLQPTSLLNAPVFDGKVFSLLQLKKLQKICAIVIPQTDTLGAAEVNTHGFIDNQLFHCYENSEQEQMKALLTLIERVSNQQFSSSFTALNSKQQFDLLTDLDLGQNNFNAKQRTDFKVLKRLICFGYYTSEVGASKELRYLAVPGGYKGSIPYKKTDASWGSQGLFY